ncbi:hypothetical protein IE077_004173 [Cardiosporidium cionae]|uniref:Origin recognition complex subunit 5 n=1 Tax=Cardiosporidium cionae TaxID=476202 RepID=A0ABQ7JE01_9APIC|nr:hypothetical protein IE077_004173 [Cardiosporidium cionae]|eukprot:KAF8822234.1 hypothetical protein IE077_004173 [Cardiosporidium cionae]
MRLVVALFNSFSQLRHPVPILQLVGPPGMGKTSLIKDFLSFTGSAWAYADCAVTTFGQSSIDNEVLYKILLNGLYAEIRREWEEDLEVAKDAPKWNLKSENLMSKNRKNKRQIKFKVFEKMGCIQIVEASCPSALNRAVVIVIDNARDLMENHMQLLCALLRHKEYFSNVDFDLSKPCKRGIPVEVFPGDLSAFCIEFDAYNQESCRKIFSGLFSELAMDGLNTVLPAGTALTLSDHGEYTLRIALQNAAVSPTSSTPSTIKEVLFTETELASYWNKYVNEFVNICYAESKGNFNEMLFLCRQMWTVFMQPFLQGEVSGNHSKHPLLRFYRLPLVGCISLVSYRKLNTSLETVLELRQVPCDSLGTMESNLKKLQYSIGRHFKIALSNYGSHFISDLRDTTFLKTMPLHSQRKSAGNTLILSYNTQRISGKYLENAPLTGLDRVELPFIGRILVVAAALASFNNPNSDSSIMEQSMVSIPAKRRRKIPNGHRKILTPKPFTFIRWLALSDCLAYLVTNYGLEINSLLYEQITSLVRLRLITPWNTAEKFMGTSRSLTMQPIAAKFSELQYMNEFGEPFNSSSAASNIQKRIASSDQLFHLIDPFIKLFCQLPLEMVREMAKNLRNVKLDELLQL